MTPQSGLDDYLERQADPDIDGTEQDCPKCGGEMVDMTKIDRSSGEVYCWRKCIALDCGYVEE